MAERDEPQEDEPEETRHWREALGTEPPLTDQSAWLVYNKKKWKLQRKERHRLQAMGISGASVMSRGGGLGNYFEKQSATVSKTHWEVVQMVETDEPGMMRVWALVAGDLHCMKVCPPRVAPLPTRIACVVGSTFQSNPANRGRVVVYQRLTLSMHTGTMLQTILCEHAGA